MIVVKIKELVASKGISITELYRRTGISRTTLTPLINKPESTKAMRYSTLNSLCSYLECSVSDIFEYIPDEIPKDLNEKLNLIEKNIYEEKTELLETIKLLESKNSLTIGESNSLNRAINIYNKL